MNAVVKKIEDILKSSYDTKKYLEFTRELFPGMKIVAPDKSMKEFTNFSSHIESSTHIGNYETSDDKEIVIFAVELKKANYVEGSRSTQRSYAKKIIENAGADAAFIAYYTKDEPKWRVSLVRLDYEMKFENGRLQAAETITPAKRYSYLVGKDEPCHTAISRFKKFIIDGENDYSPSLEELEEAFSVEKVTNEFFELYREKFLQLKEELDSNEDFVIEAEQHNYTSAQFAKKLMGQIVFLYFLQKKGWLGVNALPKILTEKEYKNAFFAQGAKSRQIVPIAYKQDGNMYRLFPSGMKKLSDEEEEILANSVKGAPWGSGPHNFMRTLFNYALSKGVNYFDDVLEPLFYDALNVNRGEQGYCPALHCRIPFLSGGLFEPIDGYDWKHNDFAIPNEVFSNAKEKGALEADGILDIFDRYNFTMSEDEPMEREVAIDPEMLGKVFENLLEVNDRKSKGAFYTPREIVHYMCQETLISYLVKTTSISEHAIREFIIHGDLMKDEDTVKEKRLGNGGMYISEEIYKMGSDGEVEVNRLLDIDKALKSVRVADPSVGSGAFPLGMLNEIVRARQNISAYMSITMNSYQIRMMYSMERSPYAIKYETIKNCLFAADIEPSAVDIAQLRLWLSLVIDDEINPDATNPLEGHRNPTPLPNLECNIVCGDSLSEEFEGSALINDSIKTNQIDTNTDRFNTLLEKIVEKQDELFKCDDTLKKKVLIESIEELKTVILMSQLEGSFDDKIQRFIESRHAASKPYVLWQIDFSRVFKEKGGFDIVIGNPPYVDSEEMTKSMPEKRELYAKKYKTAKGNWDLFIPFIEKGMELCSDHGTQSYIVPNKLISAPYSKTLRKQMLIKTVSEIRDYSNVNVFKSASVYPVVFRIEMEKKELPVKMSVMDNILEERNSNCISFKKFYSDIEWDKYFNTTMEELELIDKISSHKKLCELATVNGAATVGEAYEVKEFLYDANLKPESNDNKELLKFINTRGLDRYKSWHGIEPMRYLKDKYDVPMVSGEDVKSMSERRYSESVSEKIIIGGMTKILECFYDYGEYLAGKSTTIVYDNEHLKYITAILNSKLITFYYQVVYNSMSLSGGFYRIGAPQIKEIPIAMADKAVIQRVESLVDEMITLISSCDDNTTEIEAIDEKIDKLVYTTYNLTNKEIQIIEDKMVGKK